MKNVKLLAFALILVLTGAIYVTAIATAPAGTHDALTAALSDNAACCAAKTNGDTQDTACCAGNCNCTADCCKVGKHCSGECCNAGACSCDSCACNPCKCVACAAAM